MAPNVLRENKIALSLALHILNKHRCRCYCRRGLLVCGPFISRALGQGRRVLSRLASVMCSVTMCLPCSRREPQLVLWTCGICRISQGSKFITKPHQESQKSLSPEGLSLRSLQGLNLHLGGGDLPHRGSRKAKRAGEVESYLPKPARWAPRTWTEWPSQKSPAILIGYVHGHRLAIYHSLESLELQPKGTGRSDT